MVTLRGCTYLGGLLVGHGDDVTSKEMERGMVRWYEHGEIELYIKMTMKFTVTLVGK